MMWTTCFVLSERAGAIESTSRDRPFDRRRLDPDLLCQLSRERDHQALAGLHAASGKQPDVPAPLLVTAEQDPPVPAQHRRDPDARLEPHSYARDEPKPRAPRSLAGSSSTSTARSCGNGEHDELRDSHARLDHETLLRVRVQEHDPELAAIARVDQPRRVDDRDPVPRCKSRARLHEARMALGDRDGEPGADGRPLARPELDALARRQVEAGIARVGALGDRRVLAQPRDRELESTAFDRGIGARFELADSSDRATR